jgi:hypothetical protein
MAVIVTRAGKGSPLTHSEVDANFVNLNASVPSFNVRDFGAVGNDTGDDTAAFQAAIDAAYAATGGSLGGARVFIPAGTYRVTSVSRQFNVARTVHIQGEGRLATVIRKIGVTTDPVFTFFGNPTHDPLGTPFQGVDLSDFTVLGNAKVCPGIRLSLMTNWTVSRVSVFTCTVGVDLVGSLIGSFHDCVLVGNDTGLRTRKFFVSGYAGDGIFCNSWSFHGGTINTNAAWGVDLGDSDGVYFRGTNLERNGIANNTATGAIIIRNTVDDESVYSVIDLANLWFEFNEGRMIEVEAAAGLTLNIRNCHVYANTGSSTINVGAIRRFNFSHTPMRRGPDTVISAAARTLIIGETPNNYTDNSTTTFVGG